MRLLAFLMITVFSSTGIFSNPQKQNAFTPEHPNGSFNKLVLGYSPFIHFTFSCHPAQKIRQACVG